MFDLNMERMILSGSVKESTDWNPKFFDDYCVKCGDHADINGMGVCKKCWTPLSHSQLIHF